MAFFTSDPRIAEVYANPEVKQAIGPGSARSWSGTVGGQQGMLSNLGVSSQTTSGAFSYDTPTAEQLWGQLSTGVTSSLGADALAIASGGTYTTTAPTTGDTSVIDALPEPVEYPVDLQPMPIVVKDSGDSATGLFDMQIHEDILTSGEWGETPWQSAFNFGYDYMFPTAGGSIGGLLSRFLMGGSPIAGLAGTLLGNQLERSLFPEDPVSIEERSTGYGMVTGPDGQQYYSMGGYTWDPSLGTPEEMMEETGLGTQMWDPSHPNFTWEEGLTVEPTAPTTIEEALEKKVAFGQEGDATWTDGTNVYHSSDYDWNADQPTPTPTTVETVVPDTSGTITQTDGDGYSDAGSASDEDMAEAGFSQEEQDFIDSGFDDGGDSGGGDSYIATAATQALGEEGLKVFEDWRDYMFTALPTFTASFGRYRVTAPKIVAEIDKKDNSKDIYSWIWDMHLKPIFDLIKEDKDSDKALKDYKVMVKDLQNKFLVKEKR